eukprot:scaffold178001_cov51-Attheya_sp.AAC.1
MSVSSKICALAMFFIGMMASAEKCEMQNPADLLVDESSDIDIMYPYYGPNQDNSSLVFTRDNDSRLSAPEAEVTPVDVDLGVDSELRAVSNMEDTFSKQLAIDGDSSHARKLGSGITSCQGEPNSICIYKFKRVSGGGCQMCKTDVCCFDITRSAKCTNSDFCKKEQGGKCSHNEQCKTGYCHDTSGSGNHRVNAVCQCNVQSHCSNAQFCHKYANGVHKCEAKLENDNACSAHADCVHGNCRNNKCQCRLGVSGTCSGDESQCYQNRENYECQHNCRDNPTECGVTDCHRCNDNNGVCESGGCRPARCNDEGNFCVNGNQEDLHCIGGKCVEKVFGRRNGALCLPGTSSISCSTGCCRNAGKNKGQCKNVGVAACYLAV